MSVTNDDLKYVSTTIRTLTMDAVQKANSGHPGMPMGCADIAAVLWCKIMRYNPEDPGWPNRDRFVLSAGHGSMLLYSMLHLSGYGISLNDIKNFRQYKSLTPGHPEHTITPGVETSTGPLGQGFANGVGMAIARDLLASQFNSDNKKIIDHYIYAIVSDGDLMEGISSEAASLAGHLGLGNLIYIYDSNHISIEGDTNITFSDDTEMRFKAYNWHVQKIDGNNYSDIEKAVRAAQQVTDRPSLIIADTLIAWGSATKEGSESSHGAPLGADEVRASKEKLGCDPDAAFAVPDEVYSIFKKRVEDLKEGYRTWNTLFAEQISGNQKKEWDRYFLRPDIAALRKELPDFLHADPIATRSASGKVIEKLYAALPNLIGGSADLAGSNKTFAKGYSETGDKKLGRNFHFGIREHAMGAIQNGIAYYGGFISYTATFLVFMDYMRPAVRIAALAGLHSIYIFTHDSFFVGEDGPTHQPVEHLAAARAIPNLTVIRPADAAETTEAWLQAIGHTDGPVMLALTRQNLPCIERKGKVSAADLEQGAYIIQDTEGEPDIVILASGSEVHLSMEAADELANKGIAARVVSFPSWELFDRQPDDYRQEVLSHGTPKVVVEAGIRMGWERYAGNHALFITLDHFGRSAPAGKLAEEFGFTVESVVEKVVGFVKSK